MMQLIIDIPDKIYNYVKRLDWPELETEVQADLPMAVVCKAVKEGMSTMIYPQVEGITPTVVEPCTDAISRQAAIDAFERFIHELGIEDEPYNYGEMALSVKNVPSVTPAEKVGRWITDRCDMYICSKCNHTYTDLSGERYGMNYCPNCGCKMEGF